MKQEYQLLYQDMLQDIQRCRGFSLPETETTECCYQVAMNYWQQLKKHFQQRIMYVDAEEMEFFKIVKPMFTAHIEYNLILNQGLLFIPTKTGEAAFYWEEESRRYQRFYDRNRDFIEYYESGNKEKDAEYFLQRNNRLILLPQERIYDDEDCRSSHDYLIRSLLANRMYKDYADKRIKLLIE